jgi:hypothetical protein
VRSYAWTDQIFTRYPTVTKSLTSENGALAFAVNRVQNYGFTRDSMWGWHLKSFKPRPHERYQRTNSFFYYHNQFAWGIEIAHWLLLLLSATFAMLPWLRRLRQFSLRTLLIATTLIAVLLATAAYLRLW